MTFTTTSGSVYELDPDRPRIRRLSGPDKPTSALGEDGQWQEYALLGGVVLGTPVTIVWRFEGGVAKATITAPVAFVTEND